MDYRNDNRTPRDRVDEDFFRSILRDEELIEERNRVRPNTGDAVPSSAGMKNSRHLPQNRGQQGCSCEYRRNNGGKGNLSACPSTKSWNDCLERFPLAMVYIPPQSFTGIMEIDVALKRGTIFKELDLPFYYSGCKGEMCR